MFPSDLGTSWETLAVVAVSTIGAYAALVLFSRIFGLRSFSQMTNFDLAASVAFGTMVGSTALSAEISLLQGVVGLVVLFAAQALLAQMRRRRSVTLLIDNRPLLLMSGSQVLSENLARAQISRSDLSAKLRLAGVTSIEHVGAVILEATGDVSVLTKQAEPIDPDLLATVDRGRTP